jgi:hypothetical protein
VSAPRALTGSRTLGNARVRRLLIATAVLAGAALLFFGLRVVAADGQAWWDANHRPTAAAGAAMPTSSQIEEAWGIRFTLVQLLADNGMVELRYEVLDVNKANRLHADSSSLTDIPYIRVEGIGKVVKANSLMFHIHHDWTQGVEGRNYSIVYGNAGGVIYRNALVTIVMSDGLSLQHIPVRG